MAKKQTESSLEADVNDVIGDIAEADVSDGLFDGFEADVADVLQGDLMDTIVPDADLVDFSNINTNGGENGNNGSEESNDIGLGIEMTDLTDFTDIAEFRDGIQFENMNVEMRNLVDVDFVDEMFREEVRPIKKPKKLVIEESSSMINPSLGDLLDVMDSKYTLVVAASKRARQLADGADSMVSCDSKKPVSIACHEIKNGKVSFHRIKDGIK